LRRRQELLQTWHKIMGPWPEVIAKPKRDVLSSVRRDRLTQERVRLEIAP
jgi:hypothetical protein